MDTTLKQRILGIIVLVALLGICLSVLLHHNKNPQHSKMPSMNTTATAPAIVNTTSSLLNSNNSANMTPANTNVFDSDVSAPSNVSTTTPAPSTVTTATSQAQPQQQQLAATPSKPATAQTQTSSQSPAAYNATAPQSPAQPIVNNAVSAETVATSTIKPLTPPTSSTTPQAQDATAQINATTTNANAATTNTDDAYTSLSSDNTRSPATAIPTNNTATAVEHKTTTHAHAKTAKIAVAHKKTATIQHATAANATPHAAVSNTQATGTGYVLQVGSFNLAANAETLADKLRAKGFVTSIQKSHTAQGDMTRVVVGKNGLDRTQVETLRHQLQTEMQIQGFVVPQNNNPTATSTSKTHSNTPATKHVSASPSSTNANDEI